MFDGACHFDAGGDTQLVEDVPHVRLHGLAAQVQRGRDLAIRLAVGRERGDLELTLGQ